MAKLSEPEDLPVREAREGDGQAWDTLFRRYQLPLYAYVVELVRDEQAARDVVQEAFVNATRYIRSLRDDARFGSWLFGIAHQKCQQHWRRRKWEMAPLEEQADTLVDPSERPDAELVRLEDRQRFMQALRDLAPPHREVLLLHFLEDFPLQEIADITGVSLGTVKSRIHYAKKALSQTLRNRP
jgi:RNA polymerase sigma-70 factor (ECF subfamily)